MLNNQNDFLQNLNSQKDNNMPAPPPPINHTNNLFVLSILADRFKTYLNYSFPDELKKWKNDGGDVDGSDDFFSLIKNVFNRRKINRSDDGGGDDDGDDDYDDDEVVMNIRKFVQDSCDKCGNSIRAHISFCEEKVKKRADEQSPSDGNNIESICEDIFREIDTRQSGVLDRRRTTSIAIQNNVHPLFGDFFSLFDFIVSATISGLPDDDDVDADSKYDFLLLNVQIVSYSGNGTTLLWRPVSLFHQNQINNQILTTHTVLPERNKIWFSGDSIDWTCGIKCWIITTLALILFLISMVVSIAVGIAVR